MVPVQVNGAVPINWEVLIYRGELRIIQSVCLTQDIKDRKEGQTQSLVESF